MPRPGFRHSSESRAKMAASHAWRRHAPVTPDHADRISETLIAYYAKVSPPVVWRSRPAEKPGENTSATSENSAATAASAVTRRPPPHSEEGRKK